MGRINNGPFPSDAALGIPDESFEIKTKRVLDKTLNCLISKKGGDTHVLEIADADTIS